MARADELRELLLAQAFVHPILDQQPGQLAEVCPLGLLATVRGALSSAAARAVLGAAPARTDRALALDHEPMLSELIRPSLRSIPAGGSGRAFPLRVHTSLEVGPSRVRD